LDVGVVNEFTVVVDDVDGPAAGDVQVARAEDALFLRDGQAVGGVDLPGDAGAERECEGRD
jgi:hypothetical protein